MSNETREHQLGVGSNITRRDFLNGVGITVGASLIGPNPFLLETFGVPDAAFAPEKDPNYYPPSKTGLRGCHAGSFEVAHSLRDGKQWPEAKDEKETYDLIVVGGGISGLAAASFYRKSFGPKAKILILDNHDDFGGHAKRNEFHAGDRLLLGYGGTQSIEGPGHYSPEAIGLLKEIGIDVQRFYKYFDQNLYKSMNLKRATFFDKETFGVDRLVPGAGMHSTPEVIPQIPIDEAARKDLVRLETEAVDYLPDLTPEQKRVKLTKTSYKDFLLQSAKVHPDIIKLFQTAPHGLYGVGIDAISADTARGMGYSGFKGMPTPTREHEDREPYIFHFPDGNASIARLLVRSLVPGSAPGSTMEDIVTAKINYAKLDDPASPVRIRLNSTAIRAVHVGVLATSKEVEVTYVRGGRPVRCARSNAFLPATTW
jgi:spermidine dehydrogenase